MKALPAGVTKQALLGLMDTADVVYLATVHGGGPHIRALVNLRRSDQYPSGSQVARAAGFAVYFSTSYSSGKFADIRQNPAVAAYFCDPGRYHGLMLTGDAEVVDDPELKQFLWDDSWRVYWSGPGDPDYAVLRLQPSGAAGWWETSQFTVDLASL